MSADPEDLRGRTALVSGAASDIGAAVCAALLARGARVRATDLPGDRLDSLAERLTPTRSAVTSGPIGALSNSGAGELDVVGADLADPEDAVRVAAEPADVLAAVAGLPVVERFAESDPARWELLWQVNLRAPMLLTRGLVAGMAERGWGRLVYVASDSARAGAGGEAVYAATKAGLLGFAKSVAREVAARGVTANVVCPGPIDTAASRAILDERPRLREGLLRVIPARALGEPADVAAAVAYLASPEAGYVTGQTLSVNGGITMT
ncbi:MAG TPA: SDR family oxidoreductase [Solirubrobacterales bacterium]|nr:SDR family oxidoreductase [Solirubrobacterales bacterium]